MKRHLPFLLALLTLAVACRAAPTAPAPDADAGLHADAAAPDASLPAGHVPFGSYIPGAGGASGPAGGDLSGTYPNPTVAGMTGVTTGASTGRIRLASGDQIMARNSGNTADMNVVNTSGNDVFVGDTSQVILTQLQSTTATSLKTASSSLNWGSGGLLQWGTITDAPNLQEPAQNSATNPSNFTITPQAPWASASTGPTGTPGSLVVALATPVSTGANAGLTLQRGGTTFLNITGDSTPSATISAPNGNLILQATTNDTLAMYGDNMTFRNTAASVVYAVASSSQWQMAVPLTLGSPTLQYLQGVTSPTFSQAQQANASNPQNLTIAPQAPGAGAASTATGTPGSLVVNLATPVSTGTNPGIIMQEAGVNEGYIITSTNGVGGIGNAMVIYGKETTPSSTNWFFSGSAGQNFVNGTLEVGLGVNGNIGTAIDIASNGVQLLGRTNSFGGGNGVIGWTNATTAPTSNPSGGGVLWEASGSLSHRSSSGAIWGIAPANIGSVNTQHLTWYAQTATAHTTAASSTVLWTGAAITASHVMSVKGRITTIDTTTLSSSAAAEFACSFVNSAGTLVQLGATTTVWNHNYTTAPTCAASGTTIQVSFTPKTADASDTQGDVYIADN